MIIQNFTPYIGGTELQALELAHGLVSQGVMVDVLTRSRRDASSEEVIRGVHVKRLFTAGPGLINAFFFSLSLSFHLLRNRATYDVYHVHLVSSHALVPAMLGRCWNKKVIVKLGGANEVGEKTLSALLGRIKVRLLGFMQPIFVLVNHDQQEELRQSGLAHLETEFIPNGVNLNWFTPASPDQRNALRQEKGWSGFVFLFVGRFATNKFRNDTFDYFTDAWVSVIKEVPSARFVMVGEGPLEPYYRKRIAEKGIGSSFLILGPTDRVRDFYQAANIFVLPSLSEGLSNALLEAMGCGLPVMASRVSGIVDVVREGEQGFLFDPQSVGEIRNAFLSALTQPERDNKMGRVCSEMVKEFSLENTVRKTRDLYQR